MGERILRDRLETLQMKDLDKFDRAAIVLLCSASMACRRMGCMEIFIIKISRRIFRSMGLEIWY